MNRKFGRVVGIGLSLLATVSTGWAQTATLLPNAIQNFLDNNGKPLANGKVYFYVPSTTTAKTTWTTAGESVAQPQPVPLGTTGRPASPIYGDGSYRQVVQDQFNNVIWDYVTASTGSGGGGGGTTVGDGNIVGTVLPWSGLVAPPNYLFAYGQVISRAAYPLFTSTVTISTNLICTLGLNVLSGIADTSQIRIGAPVEASCMPPGTTVTAIAATSVTVSANASISTAIAATFFPYGNGDGSITLNVPDLRGQVLAGRNNMGGTASSVLTSTFFGSSPNALGAVGGAQSNTLIVGNLPPYTPTGAVTNGAISISGGTNGAVNTTTAVSAGGHAFADVGPGIVATQGGSSFSGVAQGGASTPLSRIPPTFTINYIIKVLPDSSTSAASGVASLGGMTGVIACGVGLTCAGQTISNSFLMNLTAGLPVIGNGTSAPTTGTKTGSTTLFVTGSGSYVATNCIRADASGNLVDAGLPCNAGTNVSYSQDYLAGTNFTAGTTTSLTLTNAPISSQSTSVYFDGVRQSANTWNLVGSVVTFSAAIPLNTLVVEISSLTTLVVPTWVTAVNGVSGNVAVGNNLLNNSSFGLTTLISTVMVSATPTAPQAIPIANFTTVGGSNTNAVGFITTGSVGPNGVGGLASGKLVAIMGPNHGVLNLTNANVTLGTTISNQPNGTFTQSIGDLLWITGGTNHSARTQFRVTAVAGDGTSIAVNGALVNETGVTFTITSIQGGYAIDPTVNGMPQAGNPFAVAFYYYPLQVSAVGTNVFNASMAGHDLNAGTTSTASAWEVTNGVQGTGSPGGPDWWQTTTTLSWYKMRGYDWDGTTVVNMPGELYSVKIVKGAASEEDFWYDLTAASPAEEGAVNAAGLAQFQGKYVTLGAYVWSAHSNEGRLYVSDGITKTYSSFVSTGSYQWVEVTALLSSSATKVEVGFSADIGAIGDQFFLTQPIAVMGGGKIGVGNYKRAPMAAKMAYNHINPFYYIGRTVPVGTFINIEQETCGLFPTGMQAIQTDIEAYNNNTLSYVFMTNSDVQQMTALTLYNQTTSGSIKNVNTMLVGVSRRLVQDGTFSFYQDTHYLGVGDTHFNMNIDYLGGIYQ